MPIVKVWNDNEHEHSELYKGDRITIAPHAHVEMEWEEAIQFRGQFTPIKYLGDGQTQDPRGYKMIRVEQPSEPIFREPPHIMHATGRQAATASELGLMLREFAAENNHRSISDNQTSRVENLEKQLAEVQAQLAKTQEKRGPGRPPKREASA